MLYRILPNTKPMYVMALSNLNKWKTKANQILKKLAKELEQDMNYLDVKDSDSDETDVKEIDEDLKEINSLKHDEASESKEEMLVNDDQKIKERQIEISNCIEAAWKNIKLDPVAWEEADEIDSTLDCSRIWKNVDDAWVDEDGILTRPRRSVKIVTKNNHKAIE